MNRCSGTLSRHGLPTNLIERRYQLVRSRPLDAPRLQPIRGDQRKRIQKIRKGQPFPDNLRRYSPTIPTQHTKLIKCQTLNQTSWNASS
jgi:hypothetical protein